MLERLEKVLAYKADGLKTKAIATKMNLTIGQVKHCLYRESSNKAVETWKAKKGNKYHYKIRYNRLKALWLKEDETCVICDKKAEVRHHKVYGEKEFAFQEIYNSNSITEEMIAAEVLKTIPVCRRCHRLIHLGKIIDPDLYAGPIQIILRDGNEFNGVSYDE